MLQVCCHVPIFAGKQLDDGWTTTHQRSRFFTSLCGGMQILNKTMTGETITLEVESQGTTDTTTRNSFTPINNVSSSHVNSLRMVRLQLYHPERVYSSPRAPPSWQDANFRQDFHQQDEYVGRRVSGHHRQCDGVHSTLFSNSRITTSVSELACRFSAKP